MSGGGSSVREPDANRPGSVLRAEREALGVTVREVAETLNLSMAVIEAIENDDLDRLPGTVFARGYVRAYARLLELEPGPLVAQYPRAPDAMPPAGAPSEPAIWEWIRRRPALVLGAAGALLVVVLLVLVTVFWPGDGDGPAGMAGGSGSDAATDGGPSAEVDSPADWIETPDETGAAPAAGGPADRGAGATVAYRDADDVGSRDAISGTVGTTMTAEPASGPAALGLGGAARRITDRGDDQLHFAFSDDCWVEIRSGNGTNLYSNLSRAGSELDLVGQGPFRILLGYAPGAQLTFNDEPVPLAPHTRDNVATLVLGQ